MLVDIEMPLELPDLLKFLALAVGESPEMVRLQKGVYEGPLNTHLTEHLTFEERFPLGGIFENPPYHYGVIDTPTQFVERYGHLLEAEPRPLIVRFTHIPKNPGEEGGWRWHKWGPYLGDGQPTKEYLDDEQDFDAGVYVYSVHVWREPGVTK